MEKRAREPGFEPQFCHLKAAQSWASYLTFLCLCFLSYKIRVIRVSRGFPGGSNSKGSAWNVGDLGLILVVGKIPWRKEWHPTPVFLPGEFHGQKSLVGYSPWGRKESDMTESLSTYAYQTQRITARIQEWASWYWSQRATARIKE